MDWWKQWPEELSCSVETFNLNISVHKPKKPTHMAHFDLKAFGILVIEFSFEFVLRDLQLNVEVIVEYKLF